MNLNNANAINFSYLLIDLYKKVPLTEEELVVILVLDHLISQGNKLISSSTLALNMSYEEKKIDDILAKLYERKVIDIVIEPTGLTISIDPLKKILYKKFEESIFSSEELKENEEAEKLRSEVYESLEELFKRSLTPVEINRVSDRLADKENFEYIKEALKEAKAKNYISINQIDKAIIRRIRQAVLNENK